MFISVDQIQKYLQDNAFGYTNSKKKAAGRSLGTIVEIITFYLLKSWGIEDSVSIETRIPEYGNSEINHNVEFSLHPIMNQYNIDLDFYGKSITANKIIDTLKNNYKLNYEIKIKNNYLLSKSGILRNACTVADDLKSNFVASIKKSHKNKITVKINRQRKKPYCILECKRVGIEEGQKRGPQTIEKAKQGAYVAGSISSLQKVKLSSGDIYGIVF